MSAETPLVHRTVRTGGIFLLVGALQFVVTMLLVETHFAGFDDRTTAILALRSTPWPWGTMFDASLVVWGALTAFGLLFAWSAFDEAPSRGLGAFALLVSSATVVAIGAYPLTVTHPAARTLELLSYAAVGAFALGLLGLAFAMRGHARWRISRAYTLATAVAILAVSALYALRLDLGLGYGSLERVALGVALVWAIVEGAHVALLHRFAPGLQVKVAAA
jgi:hypothetical membrane protein